VRALIADLETAITRTTTENSQVAIPGNVAELASTLLSKLGWRIRK
jgi:hypothetical protein